VDIKKHDGKSLSFLTAEPDDFDASGIYSIIVLLHGYGSHMGDLVGLSEFIGADRYIFAFPNAPFSLGSVYGYSSFAWAEIEENMGNTTNIEEMIKESEQRLEYFFEDLKNLYPIESGNMVLGGFSQGAIMTYGFGLLRPDEFSGLVALSGRIQNQDQLNTQLPEDRSQDLFVAHGIADMVIPIGQGREAHRFLEECGYLPEYHEYQMGHEINEAVIGDLSKWIRGVFDQRDH